MGGQTIVRLQAENVKRLQAVEIRPDGAAVVVGGQNEQGKTSVLDSIEMAFGGGRAIPEKPVRDGAKKARVVAETETLIVTRTFRAGGKTQLEVKARDGRVFSSPQTMLDELVGELSFDPLAFSRMKPKEQADALRGVLGLDFSDLDERRGVAYAKRTDVNRELKQAQAKLEGRTQHDDVPAERVSVLDLAQEKERRLAINRANDVKREELVKQREKAAEKNAEIDELTAALAKAKEELDAIIEGGVEMRRAVDLLVDEDAAEVRDQIMAHEEVNEKIAENLAIAELELDIDSLGQAATDLTAEIAGLDRERVARLESAEFPVPGMSLCDDLVYLDGVPLSQASSARALRVSVALGLAQNPGLRVLLIRDGSILDENSLRMVRDMAEQAGAQLWIERVGHGEECQVIIEDGRVADAR